MTESVEAELFVPLPMWFAAFAGDVGLTCTSRSGPSSTRSSRRPVRRSTLTASSPIVDPGVDLPLLSGDHHRDQADRSRNKRPNGRARRGRESALPRTNVERRDQDRTSESPVRNEARDRGQSRAPSPWLSLQEGSPRLRWRHHSSTGCRVHTEARRGVHRWVLRHSCPVHGRVPTSNTSYWVPKLRINRDRDRRVDRPSLKEAGRASRLGA